MPSGGCELVFNAATEVEETFANGPDGNPLVRSIVNVPLTNEGWLRTPEKTWHAKRCRREHPTQRTRSSIKLLGQAQSRNQSLDNHWHPSQSAAIKNQQMTNLDNEFTKAQVDRSQTEVTSALRRTPRLTIVATSDTSRMGTVHVSARSIECRLVVNGVQYHTPLLRCSW